MKILNKNHKLKSSKMFINEKVYKQICERRGVDFEKHLKRISTSQDGCENYLVPSDLDIIAEVFLRITKIIRR